LKSLYIGVEFSYKGSGFFGAQILEYGAVPRSVRSLELMASLTNESPYRFQRLLRAAFLKGPSVITISAVG
jgi:hypothetical protein